MTPQLSGSLATTIGFVVVMLVVNLTWYLTVRYLGRSNDTRVLQGSEQSAETASVDIDADSVRCRECEMVNERDYQYCRSCVSTLPSAGDVSQLDRLSFGRFVP